MITFAIAAETENAAPQIIMLFFWIKCIAANTCVLFGFVFHPQTSNSGFSCRLLNVQ